jgi:hypothetical protein
MPDPKIHLMTSAQVMQLPRRPPRRRRARLRPRPAAGSSTGRAWINGREVGGGDPRFDHLAISYD